MSRISFANESWTVLQRKKFAQPRKARRKTAAAMKRRLCLPCIHQPPLYSDSRGELILATILNHWMDLRIAVSQLATIIDVWRTDAEDSAAKRP